MIKVEPTGKEIRDIQVSTAVISLFAPWDGSIQLKLHHGQQHLLCNPQESSALQRKVSSSTLFLPKLCLGEAARHVQ